MESRYEELAQAFDTLLVCAAMAQAGRWSTGDIPWTLDGEDFYDAVLSALDGCCDFVKYDYDEGTEDTHIYLSDPCMLEYYRLCRAYSQRRGLKLKDNPHVQKAQQFVHRKLFGPYTCSYVLHTKVNHKRASGIHFIHGPEFCEFLELLQRMLAILDFYKEGAAEMEAA